MAEGSIDAAVAKAEADDKGGKGDVSVREMMKTIKEVSGGTDVMGA